MGEQREIGKPALYAGLLLGVDVAGPQVWRSALIAGLSFCTLFGISFAYLRVVEPGTEISAGNLLVAMLIAWALFNGLLALLGGLKMFIQRHGRR